MTSAFDLAGRFAATATPWLLSHLWSSTIFLVLVLLTLAILRRRLTASARFVLAAIGILKFAVPGHAIAPLLPDVTASSRPLELPLQIVGGGFRFDAAPATPAIWPAVVLAVWLAVALFLMIRFTVTRHRLVSLAVRTALPASRREVEALSRARRRVGLRRGVDLARSAVPEAPAVLRTFRPLVVLPASGLDYLSDDEMESLLAHECAHVVRQDNLIARVESFICALFWFHPLMWVAQRVTVIERERACDEAVAGSARDREMYLAALAKFCHAAIAPRLPGVSCMATAKLKERIDHVMNYPSLQAQSPSAGKITVLATAFLVLFTLAAAIVGGDRALALSAKKAHPYAIKVIATRSDQAVVVRGTVTENETGRIVAAPVLSLSAGEAGATSTTHSDGVQVVFKARPEAPDTIVVEVEIDRDGTRLQSDDVRLKPQQNEADAQKFTGQPISMNLQNAEIRDVIVTFGKLTGLEMRIDEDVRGQVSVYWRNVPWDEAFDSLLKENGLTYTVEGSSIHVSKK